MMIGFGELRKKSLEWQTEISTVERYYALDWLLKGIYDRAALAENLVLRGASALSKAYFAPGGPNRASYPQVEDVDFGTGTGLDAESLEQELASAAQDAARQSGLQFRLHSFQPTKARVEFTGPLGRRSAAQPLIPLRFVNGTTQLNPVLRPLIHPFSDECKAVVRAVALEELVAARIVLWSHKPRARDVYDLWFIVTHAGHELDQVKTREVAQSIAAAKRVVLRADLDPTYVPLLERAWTNALKEIRARPAFDAARREIESWARGLAV